jgi:hypothetical protein
LILYIFYEICGKFWDVRVTALLCKKIIVAKSKEVETRRSNSHEWTILAETSEEDYGSKRAVLPMMMMLIMMWEVYL